MTLLKFKLTDKVNKIVKNAKYKNYKHVMITDESGLKVLGLLFISDLTKVITEAELLKVEESLQAFIETNEIIDDITKTRWGKQGVKNFVTENMDDTLKNVVDKMKELDDSLIVRAVVTEKDAPKAIFTYNILVRNYKNDILPNLITSCIFIFLLLRSLWHNHTTSIMIAAQWALGSRMFSV
jgi:hypothetical protein